MYCNPTNIFRQHLQFDLNIIQTLGIIIKSRNDYKHLET